QPGASLVGNLDGGDGLDLLSYSPYPAAAPVVVDLSANTATDIGGLVSNIENLTGGSGDDDLSGDAANNILTGGPGDDDLTGRAGDDTYIFADGWGTDTIFENAGEGRDTLDFSAVTFSLAADINAAITISGSGNLASHNGNHIEVVIGGSDKDTFTITGDRPVTLIGSGEADLFIFNDAATLTAGAYLDGSSGVDTLNYTAYKDPRNWVLTDLGTIDGFMGTEASIDGGFDNINAILGKLRTALDPGTDSLTGLDAPATWNINVTGLQYISGGRTLDFSNIENLIGGSQDDTFVFAAGAVLPGDNNSIAGKSGTDTLDYSAYTTPVEVYLQGGIATGTMGGVSSIENVIGSIVAANIIHGDDNDNVLVSGSTDDILIGYGGNDTYVFDADNPLGNDTVDEQTGGGGGTDTLDFSDTTTLSIVIDISNGGSQVVNVNLTLTILGTVENVDGGSQADTITGNAQPNQISGGPGNDIINAGIGSDRYLFADGWGSDTLSDDGGTDILDFSALTTPLAFGINPTSVLVGDGVNLVTHTGSAFDTFIGGSAADSFNLGDGVSLAGYVDGMGGANTLNLAAFTSARNVLLTGLGDQTGFDGVDPAIANGFENISVLAGSTSSGTDLLTGLNEISAWGIDGTNTYTSGGRTLHFSAFERLTDGTAADTFTLSGVQAHTILAGADDDELIFNDGAVLTGTFDGQSDRDTINFAAYTTARQAVLNGLGSTDGFVGTINGIAGGFANVDGLVGSTVEDTITGRQADAFWNIDSSAGNQYTAIQSLTLTGTETDYDLKKAVVQGRTPLVTNGSPVTLDFVGFEILQGGDQNDLFEFTGSPTHSVLGGNGEDYFAFNDAATFTGTIDGQAGRDSLDYNAGSLAAYTTGVDFVLSSLGTANGFAGTASNITGTFDNIGEIVGGTGSDSLQGLNSDSTWKVEVYPTFSRYTTSTRSINLALVDTYLGGSAIDSFEFADNAVLAGFVDGNAGDDSLDLSAYTSIRDFVLNALGTTDGFDGTVTGITTGFADINAIIGGTDKDTITGLDADSHWAINAANSGIYTSTNALTFTTTDTLIGGSAADRFDFANGATLSGLVNGGGGTDLLDYADYNTVVTVDLSTGQATGVNGNNPGGVSLVEDISGGSNDDSLTGDSGPNTITGNAGDDQLIGLGGDDTYIFADGWGDDTLTEADSLDNDTVDFSAVTGNLDITLSSIFVTDNVSGTCGVSANCLTHSGLGIDTFIAGQGDDSFRINASLDIDLQGGPGADEFIFAEPQTLTGSIDGGADTDSLDLSAYTSGWNISLTALGTTDGFAGTASGLTVGFDNLDAIIGSGDVTDSLTGLNSIATWAASAASVQYTTLSGTGSTNSLTISGFETLIGGNLEDILTFAAFGSAANISLVSVGAVDGFDITAASLTVTFQNINTLSGSPSAADALTGLDAVSTWTPSALGATYTSTNTLSFSAIENITGGTDTDVLDYSAYTTAVYVTLTASGINGFSGTGTDLAGSFKNIDSLLGGLSSDTLTGADQNAVWTVDGTDQYTVNTTLDFVSFEILIGGNQADIFNIIAARSESLQGGPGDDSFVFANGATISTTIQGGFGSDTLDYSGYTTPVTVNLATGVLGGGVGSVSGIENIAGGQNNDNLTGDAGNNVLTGGPGTDTLAGGPGDDTYRFADGWGLDNPIIENAGEGNDTFDFSPVTNPLTFTIASITVSDGASIAQHTGIHIENLIGGSAADTFIFSNGAVLPGQIDGQSGTDTLNLSAYTSALNIRISSLGIIDGMAGGIDAVLGSFDNINSLITGSGNDTLFGMNADAAWTIDTTNTYTSGAQSMDFSGVENLTGGSGTDTFQLVGTGSVAGNVAGGLGANDTLDYSAYTQAAIVNFPAGTASGINGTVSGIETVISNGIGVTLIGDEFDNLLIGGLGNDILRGNDGNDTLVGNGGDDILDGGNGIDTADYSSSANGVVVDLAAGTASDQALGTSIGNDTLISIENVIGSNFADDLSGSNGDNVLTGGAGDDTLAGLGGNDTYKFGDNAGTDTVNEVASAGVDTFDFSAATVDLTFTIGSLTVTGTGIAVTNPASQIENLISGSGADRFVFADGASLAGYLDGRGGTDEIDFAAFASARNITLNSTGATDGFNGSEISIAGGTPLANGGFRNVDSLVGSGTNADTLIGLDADSVWTINSASSQYQSGGRTLALSSFETLNGGLGADSFNLLGTESGSFNGNAGDDSIHFAEGATLSGSFNGGPSTGSGVGDTLSFSGNTTGRAIALSVLGTIHGFAGNAAGASFDNLDNLLGGNGTDSLTGLATGSWLITGTQNSYTSTNALTFAAIENLIGGTGVDTFAFADGAVLAGGLGTLDGMGGVNGLDYSAYNSTTSVAVNLFTGTATGTNGITNIQNVIGGSGDDNLTGDAFANALTGGPGNDTLTGGGGNDTYIFGDGSGTDMVNEFGGGGTDTLDFSAVSGALTFSLNTYTGTGTGISIAFDANVENLVGGSGLDTLSYAGDGAAHIVSLTGSGSGDGFTGTVSGLGGNFDNINAFVGGSGADTLNGLSAPSTWTLEGASSQYASGGRNFGFDSSVETLNGGTGVDAFEIVGTESGTFNAGLGNDTVHFAEGASLTGSFDGGSGADTLSFSGNTNGRDITLTGPGSSNGFAGSVAGGTFDNVNVLTGGDASDSLTGLVSGAWQINGTNNSYTSTFTLNFSAIEDLVGGSGLDTFTLADGLTFSGSLDGRGGSNTLSFAAFTTARNVTLTGVGSSVGFNGTEGSLTDGFANISTLTGSGAIDTLTGTNLAAVWEIDGSNQYQAGARTLAFSAFKTLIGGSADDLFNLTGSQTHNLLGGAGDDTFKLIGTADLTGTINGGAHILGDTLDYSAYTGNVTVNLATGQATGTDGISNIESIKGGTGINTITGDDGDNILFGGSSDDILIGGKGNDTYIFVDGWGDDQVIELAGEGTDTINFSGITAATGTLTFTVGTAAIGVSDTHGNTLTYNGTAVEKLVGGDFGSTFTFENNATLNGSVTGGTGSDHLDFSQYTSARTAVLTGLGTDAGFAGSLNGMAFDNIDVLTGSSVAGDSLTGANLGSQWGLDGSENYTAGGRALDFSRFETLTGGSAADTFTLTSAQVFTLNGGAGDDDFELNNAASLTGLLNGNAGTDTLDYSAFTTPITVDLSGSAAQHISGAVTGIENVTGGDAGDVLTGNAGPNILRGGPGADTISGLGGNDILIGGADNDNLSGGPGNDTFLFELNAWGVDVINELVGEGIDTMDFSALSAVLDILLGSVTVTSGANTATHAGTFIENIIAGSGGDNFSITGNQTVNLYGGPGADTFTFADGAGLTGTLSGDAGSDELSFAPYTNGRSITLTGLGSNTGFNGLASGINGSFTNIDILTGSTVTDTLTGLNAPSTWDVDGTNQYISTNVLSFSSFETLVGGSGVDVFNISGTQTHQLLGGSGADRFVFADNSQLVGDVDGQRGTDELDFSAYTTARRIVLTDIGIVDGLDGRDFSPFPAITGRFRNMNTITGSSDIFSDDIIVGLNQDSQWVIDNLSIYTVNPSLSFSSFETIVGGDADDTFTIYGVRDVTILGGAGNDTFVLTNGATVTRTINGQGGVDTLQYSGSVLPAYNVAAGTATGVLGGIFGIEFFILIPPPPPPLLLLPLPPLSSISESTSIRTGRITVFALPNTSLSFSSIVMVTKLSGDEGVSIDDFYTNLLFLDDFAQVMFAPGVGSTVRMNTETVSSLPASLPAGYRFSAAITVDLIDDIGVPVKELPFGTWLNISFALPDDYQGFTYVILYWDENFNSGLGGWVELPVQMLYGDATLNQNITEIQTYYRYWDASANAGLGEWVTITTLAKFWDVLVSDTMGGWMELSVGTSDNEQTPLPEAVIAGQSGFTGTFVLVRVEFQNK
ncbi:MAG: hypothetical protein H8D34_20775, partial [Chloroflexi bacterium]|nr:hypothetical protein [Chloroflexota bacterium]